MLKSTSITSKQKKKKSIVSYATEREFTYSAQNVNGFEGLRLERLKVKGEKTKNAITWVVHVNTNGVKHEIWNDLNKKSHPRNY